MNSFFTEFTGAFKDMFGCVISGFRNLVPYRNGILVVLLGFVTVWYTPGDSFGIPVLLLGIFGVIFGLFMVSRKAEALRDERNNCPYDPDDIFADDMGGSRAIFSDDRDKRQ